MTKLTIADVKRHNKEAGQFFFSKDTMRFFQSRIESTLYKNHCFITSEQCGETSPREYTVRHYNVETGRIETVTAQLYNLETAREIAKKEVN